MAYQEEVRLNGQRHTQADFCKYPNLTNTCSYSVKMKNGERNIAMNRERLILIDGWCTISHNTFVICRCGLSLASTRNQIGFVEYTAHPLQVVTTYWSLQNARCTPLQVAQECNRSLSSD